MIAGLAEANIVTAQSAIADVIPPEQRNRYRKTPAANSTPHPPVPPRRRTPHLPPRLNRPKIPAVGWPYQQNGRRDQWHRRLKHHLPALWQKNVAEDRVTLERAAVLPLPKRIFRLTGSLPRPNPRA
jgi:hypothetical protein